MNKNPHLNIKQADISDIDLSDEQRRLYEKLEKTNESIFITGKAGTGKSVLLQYFKQNSSKNLVVVAPTGVAALNIGGQTIHSFFRIAPGFLTDDKMKIATKTAQLLRNIDTVVIDEISMVRVDLLNAIDFILRKARRSNLPFGGVQIVMFGDLFQLPPVVEDKELHKYFTHNFGGQYFFNSPAWNEIHPPVFELTYIFRQKDDREFKNMLNAIRTGEIYEGLLEELNRRAVEEAPEEGIVTLTTTNYLAKEINEVKLSQLPGKTTAYEADIMGEVEVTSFPTDAVLSLKKGAQVMLLKNDKDKRWVNGTIGYIENMKPEEIEVNIEGVVYSIPRESWNKIRYSYNSETRKVEEKVVSSFNQYPIKLAWAITIHKSQGQTFGTVAIDLGNGAFAHGQTYVALSRCQTLTGLYLKREVRKADVMVDPTIIAFMKSVTVLKA